MPDEQTINAETEADGFASAVAAFAKDEEPAQAVGAPNAVPEGNEPPAPEPAAESESEPEAATAETNPDEGKSPALIALEKELNTLKRENKKHQQRADYWMQNYQQRAVQPEPQKQPEAVDKLDLEPNLDTYRAEDGTANTLEYAKQWAAWNARQTVRAETKQWREQQTQQQQLLRQQEEEAKYYAYLNAKISEGQRKFGQAAFDKACRELVDSEVVTFGSNMHTTLFNLDRYPDVVMELGKNPAEAERISQLTPQKQIYELEALERKITAREELALKTQPKLPTKVEAPGQGEDPKPPSHSVTKFRQAAKASGSIHDWTKVFQADPTL